MDVDDADDDDLDDLDHLSSRIFYHRFPLLKLDYENQRVYDGDRGCNDLNARIVMQAMVIVIVEPR